MEQDDLKILKLTLEELRRRVLEDKDIIKMFLDHFPELDFEENLDEILLQIEEYAVDKNYDILELSLEGIKLFFMSVLDDEDEEEEDEVEEDDHYGKA